jgi:hypothetical protein
VSGVFRGVLLAVGALIALCSGAALVAFAVEAASGGDGKTTAGTYAFLIILTLGGTAVGAYLVWQAVRKGSGWGAPAANGHSTGGAARAEQAQSATEESGPVESDADRERRILQFAEAEHGRVTIAEVATHCRVTVTEAKTDLDRMVAQQVAQLLVTESGVLVYVFPGFLSDDEKASAHDF